MWTFLPSISMPSARPCAYGLTCLSCWSRHWRVYQGRAFYDGTGDLDRKELDRLSWTYGLIVL